MFNHVSVRSNVSSNLAFQLAPVSPTLTRHAVLVVSAADPSKGSTVSRFEVARNATITQSMIGTSVLHGPEI